MSASELIRIAARLSRELSEQTFAEPVHTTYNPLDYAWDVHCDYLRRFAPGRKAAVLVGMNPGPWGMVQTGVPFGEVAAVRDWMGLTGEINRPSVEHPKRPVDGFECSRSEVSGRRLWDWARERFGSAEGFFARFLVLNYCPLAFLEESGRNRTPDKLPVAERRPLQRACDRALVESIRVLEPDLVIGVGRFARDRCARAFGDGELEIPIGQILHPSPASPAANRGWAPQVEAQLTNLGVDLAS